MPENFSKVLQKNLDTTLHHHNHSSILSIKTTWEVTNEKKEKLDDDKEASHVEWG